MYKYSDMQTFGYLHVCIKYKCPNICGVKIYFAVIV